MRRTEPGVLLRLVLFLLLAVVVSGCGLGGVELQEDHQLSVSLRDINENGGSSPLRDLVPGDWDTVHIFHEPLLYDHIAERVGHPIDIGGEIYLNRGNILVFMKRGEVLRAVEIDRSYFGPGIYTDAVRVQPDVESLSPNLDLFDPTLPNGGSL